MTKQINWDTFDKAFRNVSAYHMSHNGEAFGRIVCRHTDSAVTAYVQIWGGPMFMARASGYGYDKRGAAVASALLAAMAQEPQSVCIADRLEILRNVPRDCLTDAQNGGGFERINSGLSQAGILIQWII